MNSKSVKPSTSQPMDQILDKNLDQNRDKNLDQTAEQNRLSADLPDELSPTASPKKAQNKTTASRQFKGLSLEERKTIRREKLIAAGIQAYGTHGFFAVTVKDICKEAKLTERYFYESFKRSEELFKVVYLTLIDELQRNIINAVMANTPELKPMINAGLSALLNTLRDDPRKARVLFVDAMLVNELHGDTIRESHVRFDRTMFDFLNLVFPDQQANKSQFNLIASGLNGYVIHIAMRWVLSDFKQPFEEVLEACSLVYLGIYQHFQNTAD